MRRTRAEARHEAPYLEDLPGEAQGPLGVLEAFELRPGWMDTPGTRDALETLWDIFRRLASDRANGGKSSEVGVAMMLLLTHGRVGLAFDAPVKARLGLGKMAFSHHWIAALGAVAGDIGAFAARHGVTLQESAPDVHAHLHAGRLCNMVFGPRKA